MKGLIASVTLALVACSAGDDTTDGTRGQCAYGGALTDCPDAARTPEGACWRMVDCGAIPLKSDNQNRFTWGACVDRINSREATGQQLIIDCIAASSCDQLRAPGSPMDPDRTQMPCFLLGGR